MNGATALGAMTDARVSLANFVPKDEERFIEHKPLDGKPYLAALGMTTLKYETLKYEKKDPPKILAGFK